MANATKGADSVTKADAKTETPKGDKSVKNMVIFSVTEKNAEQAQKAEAAAVAQVNNANEIFERAGMVRSDIRSKNGTWYLEVDVVTPQGTNVTLNLRHANAFYHKHQSNDKARSLIAWIGKSKGTIQFELKDVRVVEVATLDPSDCPI